METENRLFFQLILPARIKKLGFDLLFCVVVVGLAIFTGLQATVSGSGISPDSVTYISMGANIFHGNGFVSDLSNAFDSAARIPVTLWPPGYSLLIAGMMFFGLSALEAAKLATIFCFALVLVVVYWLAQNIAGRIVAILCSLTVLALMPVLREATFALSEMPFTLFSTLAIAAFVQYAKTEPERRWTWLILSSASTSLAVLTRYNGLLWVPTGLFVLLLLLFDNRSQSSFTSQFRQAILPAVVFTLISIIPIIPWFIRNTGITGNPTGFNRVDGIHPSFLENVRYAFGALARELLPSIHIGLRSLLSHGNIAFILTALLILLFGGGVAVIAARGAKSSLLASKGEKVLFGDYQDFVIWLTPLVYSVIYLAGLLILASMVQFPAYDWPRTLVVIYPLIFIVFLSSLSRLVGKFVYPSTTLSRQLIIAVPALLLILPYAIQSTGFISQAAQGQELSTRQWRDNLGIEFLSSHVSPQDEVFSDQPAGVSYVMNRPARYLPYKSEFNRFIKLINSPKSGALFIIVFKVELGQPDPYFLQRLSSDDIKKLALDDPDLKIVADFPDSTVYRVN